MRRRVLPALLLLCGMLGIAHAQPDAAPNLAFALGDHSFTIIDEDNLKPLAKLPLPGPNVDFWWNNAEQDRFGMVVTAGLRVPTATLVVVDLSEQKIVGEAELGSNPRLYNTSADGNRAYVVLQGRKKNETPSIVAVDSRSGTVLARASLTRLPSDFFLNDSGDGLILVFPGVYAVKEAKRVNGALELLDATTLESRKKSALPGPVTGIYLDAPGYIYLSYAGVDRKKEEKQALGELYVIDRETMEMDVVPLGMSPGPLAWDEERGVYYVLTSPQATRKEFEAELLLIGGGGVESALKIPQAPMALRPTLDREGFFILYSDRVMRADKNLESLEKVMSLKKPPSQLLEHPFNNHFYVLHQMSPQVSIIDGESGQVVDTFKSGSKAEKFGIFMAAVAGQMALGVIALQGTPAYVIGDTAYYYVPDVLQFGFIPGVAFASFSEKARFLYVYNTKTNDVTVLDTASHEVLKKVPGGRSDFHSVFDGRYLCTISPKNVRFFDVENRFAEVVEFDTANASIEEIPGTTKAYLSRGGKLPVGLIDLAHLEGGTIQELPGVLGVVVHMYGYD